MAFADAIERFEKLIHDKEIELQAYQVREGASEKAIHYKRGEIARLRGFLESVTDETETWRANFSQQAETIKKMKVQVDKLEEIKMVLEGICLLHGIDDLPSWLNRPLPLIIYDLQNSRQEGWRQAPSALQPQVSFAESFPELHELMKSEKVKQINHGETK
jgi:hypothetical protein